MSNQQREAARKVIQRMLDKLVAEYAPEKVVLFGSYAYGDPGPDSDIDLLIIKDTNERFIDRCTAVRRIVSDPTRYIALDTIVLTPGEVSKRLSIGDHFMREIMEKGEVLYGG